MICFAERRTTVVRIVVGRDRVQRCTAEHQTIVHRFVDGMEADIGHEAVAATALHGFARVGIEPERHFVAALLQQKPLEDAQRRFIGARP